MQAFCTKHAAGSPCALIEARVKLQAWSKEVPRRTCTTRPTANADRHIKAVMAEMSDLAALPAEVRVPRLTLALDFVALQTFYLVVCSALYACQAPQNCMAHRLIPLCCALCSVTAQLCLRGRCLQAWWQTASERGNTAPAHIKVSCYVPV